jgi:quercetin dioxygenase-like cupin family protein
MTLIDRQRPNGPSTMGHDITVYRDLFGDGLRNGQFTWKPYVQPGRSAVDVQWLYTAAETGAGGAEAYVAHFHPGSHGDLHEHLGFETLLILDGELHDDNGGRYPAGTLFVVKPGSVHQVSTPSGCIAIVMREKGTRPIAAAGTRGDQA